MTSREHLVELARSARHVTLAARLGMEEAAFDEWLAQRLGDRSCDEPMAGTRSALWEDNEDPNFSTYQKRSKYPRLHPAAEAALVSRYQIMRARANANILFISAIAGRYETPKSHEHLISTADYLLFSDVIEKHPLYRVNDFPYFNSDPVRMARFIKTHAHIFASGYEVAVWIDGSMIVRGDLSEEISAFIQSELPLGAIYHPFRQSIYEEGEVCVQRAKDDATAINRQLMRYRSESVYPNFLIESGLMMFRVNHPELPKIMKRWWGEIEHGSRRDQISLPYAIQKSGNDWHRITADGISVRNHRKIVLVDHEPYLDPVHKFEKGAEDEERRFREEREDRITAQAGRCIDVVVCVHNALEAVMRCLASVAAHRDPTCHRIIIVNDGSAMETTDWLRDFAFRNENCLIIEHAIAHGYTRAANAGMAASDREALVLLNSDTEVPPYWIEKLFDAFDSFPDIGIVGPMSNAASHQSLPDHKSGGGNTAINELPTGFTVPAMDRWCEEQAEGAATAMVPLVHGFCFAIRREVREAIGHFNEEEFPFGYGEENDYCMRATNAGFLLAVALHTFVFHQKSQSFESERRQALMRMGSEKLREIHGRDRIANAVRSMQENPAFVRLRHLSGSLPYHSI